MPASQGMFGTSQTLAGTQASQAGAEPGLPGHQVSVSAKHSWGLAAQAELSWIGLAGKSQALPSAETLLFWLSRLAGKCLCCHHCTKTSSYTLLLQFNTGALVQFCHMVWLQAHATVQALGTIFAASAITGDCMSYDFLATADQPAAAAVVHSAGDLPVRVDISSTPTRCPRCASLPQPSAFATPCLRSAVWQAAEQC